MRHLQVLYGDYMQFEFLSNVLLFTHVSIGTLLLLPYLSNWKRGEGYLYKLFSYVSVISYSMYLLNCSIVMHFLLHISFNFLFPNSNLIAVSILKYFCFWFLTIAGSILLYKYFERPFMQLRDRISI